MRVCWFVGASIFLRVRHICLPPTFLRVCRHSSIGTDWEAEVSESREFIFSLLLFAFIHIRPCASPRNRRKLKAMSPTNQNLTAAVENYFTDLARLRAVERVYTPDERTAMGEATSALGESTFDVYLNDHAFWRCIPAAVWNYKLGGYQVLKKWLSYRESAILGRPLKPEESSNSPTRRGASRGF